MSLEPYTKRVAIKSVLLSQLLLEQLDEIKQTTIYSNTIKNLVGKLESQLHPYCREHYDKMYSTEVEGGINVLDAVVDTIVHNAVIDVEAVQPYNLYILKDSNGNKRTIKSSLNRKDFEKEYQIRLTNVIKTN